MQSALYKATKKVTMDESLHNKWVELVHYNSPAGASVIINSIKKGTADTAYAGQGKCFAYTARTADEGKSVLWGFLMDVVTKEDANA